MYTHAYERLSQAPRVCTHACVYMRCKFGRIMVIIMSANATCVLGLSEQFFVTNAASFDVFLKLVSLFHATTSLMIHQAFQLRFQLA